jgi:hypothetical protein
MESFNGGALAGSMASMQMMIANYAEAYAQAAAAEIFMLFKEH